MTEAAIYISITLPPCLHHQTWSSWLLQGPCHPCLPACLLFGWMFNLDEALYQQQWLASIYPVPRIFILPWDFTFPTSSLLVRVCPSMHPGMTAADAVEVAVLISSLPLQREDVLQLRAALPGWAALAHCYLPGTKVERKPVLEDKMGTGSHFRLSSCPWYVKQPRYLVVGGFDGLSHLF